MPKATKSRTGSSTTKRSTTTKKTTTKKMAAKKTTTSKARSNPTRTSTKPTTGKKNKKTQVIIKYDVGYPNNIYLRGTGASLSWNKGKMLTNKGGDEWVWETSSNFNNCEFKVLINDEVYEYGNNHTINCGSQFVYTPNFG